MKKSIKLLLTLTSLLLVGCSTPTSSSEDVSSSLSTNATTSEVEQTTSEEKVIEAYTVNATVSNVFDGNLSGVRVYTSGQQLGVTDENGKVTISDVVPSSTYVLQFEKEGYDPVIKEIATLFDNKNEVIDLNVDLAKSYSHFASNVVKNWSNYENFTAYVSRNSTGMLVRLISANSVFTSSDRNSWCEVYFSVGQTSVSLDGNITQVCVYSNKRCTIKNFGTVDVSNYSVGCTVDDSKGYTVIDLEVPYAALGMQKDDIAGISFGLWSEVDKDWAPSTGLTSTKETNVNDPTSYVRVDKDNYCFLNTKNDYPEEIQYDKTEVIGDREYGVCDPNLVNVPAADDLYFKVNKTESSFVFDMVGFGDFEDNEYLKLVLHTGADKSGWQIQTTDVSFLVSKTKAAKKTNLTNFWDYTDFAADESVANNAPVYQEKEEGYFTLVFEVDFSEIPNYSADEEVSMMMIEFGSNRIYNEDPFINFMTKNGRGVGDPAAQSSYQTIQEKNITIDPNEVISQYDIKFSYDYYAKFEKKDDVLSVKIVSFNSLSDGQFVRLIIDPDGTPSDGVWSLDSKDSSIVMFKDSSYITTEKTNFWDGEGQQFHGTEKTLYNVSYEENEAGYWTMSLDIDYSELGLNVTKESYLRGMLLFFNPMIVNNHEDPNCFSFYGSNKAVDAAIQTNYFII